MDSWCGWLIWFGWYEWYPNVQSMRCMLMHEGTSSSTQITFIFTHINNTYNELLVTCLKQ